MRVAMLGVIVVWMGLAQAAMAQTPGEKDGDPVSNFDMQLYAELARGDGNVFVSPASIRSALAMTMAGARGTTAQEMTQVLGVADAAAAGAQYQSLAKQIAALQSGGAVQMSIANSLWGQEGIAFEPAFLQQLRQDYGSELLQADFRRATEAARQKVNKWVSDRTQQRITDLIASGAIRTDTQLILVNAIYLKAAWLEQFEPRMTRDGDFKTAASQSVRTKMMGKVFSATYAEDARTQMIELPYRGGSLSMFILLPREQADFRKLEESLPTALASLKEKATTRRVSLALPRFTLRYQADLVQPLTKMGMPSAFDAQADFTGMRKEGELRISNVVHQAFVAVDEQGTEAAGATAVVMRPTAMRQQEEPVLFVADHPFVFAIVERTTETVLFLGRVVDPSAK